MDHSDPADADPIDVGLAQVLLRHATSLADLDDDHAADTAYWEEASDDVKQYMLSMARAVRVHWGHVIHVPGDHLFAGVTEQDSTDEIELGDLADRIGWTPSVPMEMGERDNFDGYPGPVMLRQVGGPDVWVAWTAEHHRRIDDELNVSMALWREALTRAEQHGVRVQARASRPEAGVGSALLISHPWLQDDRGEPRLYLWGSSNHAQAAADLGATMHSRVAHRLLSEVRHSLEEGRDAYELAFRVIYDLDDIPHTRELPNSFESPYPPEEPDVMEDPLPQPEMSQDPRDPIPPPSVVRADPGQDGNFIINGQLVQFPDDEEALNDLFAQYVLSANAVAATIALLEVEKERAEAPRADPVMVDAVSERLADAGQWPNWLATAVWGHDVREVIQLVLDAATQAADEGDNERVGLQ